MVRYAIPLFVVLLLFPAPGLRAGTEVLTIDPISEKDLNAFDRVGGWALDDKTDDILTLIVCPKGKEDQTLKYRMRTFKQGFQVSLEVLGGSGRKGVEFYVVPENGDWIKVPFAARFLMKEDWHPFVVTVEKGQVWAKVAGEEGEKIAVPADQPLTFAFKVPKRNDASFRKMKVKFLVVSEEQKAAEEGFVRIFDGKTLDGWVVMPEGSNCFKLAEQRIEAVVPDSQQEPGQLRFVHAIFQNFAVRCRVAQGAKDLIMVARPNVEGRNEQPVTTTVDSYFTADKDWNEVELNVQGQQISLSVNGTQVWTTTSPNVLNCFPWFVVGRGGHAIIRDIRVKGQPVQIGPSWNRYVAESGGTAAAPPPEGGGQGGGEPAAPGGESPRMSGTRVLFNGTDLNDWQCNPADVWSIEPGATADEAKIVGITLGKPNNAEIFFKTLLFTDYRITFKIQRGTKGAKFIARGVPESVAKGKPPVLVDIKDEWLTQEWNDFEAEAFGPKLTVKVGGKQVAETMIHEVQGVIGFVIEKEGAIGVRSVVWNRPAPR